MTEAAVHAFAEERRELVDLRPSIGVQMRVEDGWDDVNAVTPAAARAAGSTHVDYWMRALWLLVRFKPNANVQHWNMASKAQRFPDLVRCKALVYLSYIADPPSCDSDVFRWRVAPDVQLGSGLCWWMERRTGLLSVVPMTLVSSAGESLLKRFGTMSSAHAHLLKIAEGFAIRVDLAVTSKNIREVMMDNPRLEGASPFQVRAAMASPDLFSDLLTPPAPLDLHSQMFQMEHRSRVETPLA